MLHLQLLELRCHIHFPPLLFDLLSESVDLRRCVLYDRLYLIGLRLGPGLDLELVVLVDSVQVVNYLRKLGDFLRHLVVQVGVKVVPGHGGAEGGGGSDEEVWVLILSSQFGL